LKVLWSKQEIDAVIKDVHEGSGDSVESISLQGHHGINTTVNLISSRFFWRDVVGDVSEYIKTCSQCQRVNPKFSKEAPNLHLLYQRKL